MSRGWIAAAIAAVVVVGVGAALVLGVFAGGDGETATDDGSIPVTVAIATTSTVGPETTTAQTLPPTTMATSDDDALCAAFEQMTADLDGHLPVEGPEDLEAVRTESVTFYSVAVPLVEAQEKTSFEEVRAYEEALFDWSEANEWEPARSLEDLTDNPPPTPPVGAFAIVTQVLEERCGVVPLRE